MTYYKYLMNFSSFDLSGTIDPNVELWKLRDSIIMLLSSHHPGIIYEGYHRYFRFMHRQFRVFILAERTDLPKLLMPSIMNLLKLTNPVKATQYGINYIY